MSGLAQILIPVAVSALLLGGCAGTPRGNALGTAISDQRPEALQPRRVGPAAMEAWIAPWESAAGDLYPEATVYISVAPERWEYDPADGPTVLRPVQLETRIDKATRAPAPMHPAPGFLPSTGQAQPAVPIPDGIRREI